MDKPEIIPWYYSKAFVILMLLSIGPLALPLIWFHPNLSLKWKTGITAITATATYALYLLCVLAFKLICEMYQTIVGYF